MSLPLALSPRFVLACIHNICFYNGLSHD
uniref:Uncharacterized protein n=1 Tax=Anguilla anguilla TaxID=7936 RepID=A0A0E9XAX2_ANGAN